MSDTTPNVHGRIDNFLERKMHQHPDIDALSVDQLIDRFEGR